MIRRGDTRRVFLVPPLVVLKWPRLKNWREGIKSNLLEREFGSCRDARLCPLVWSHRTGWLLIMRWARTLSDAEWKAFEPTCVDFSTEPDAIPVEAGRRSSYGIFRGQIVAVDYGTPS